MPLIKESIEVSGSVKIRVTGYSMQPMIYHLRDTVTIKKPPDNFKKYDLPLYIREDGKVVLHRIIKLSKDGTYVCRGDNQWDKEYGVKKEQIIGIVSDFLRKGKSVDVNSSKGYKLYVLIWPIMHHFKFLYKYFVKFAKLFNVK